MCGLEKCEKIFKVSQEIFSWRDERIALELRIIFQGIQSDVLLLDPTSKEEKLCQSAQRKKEQTNHGIMMQASLSQHNQIAELYFAGDIDQSVLKPAIEMASKSSEELSLILQQCLVKSVMESLKENKEER